MLIKIGSTWEGIKAAEVSNRRELQPDPLFGFGQAVACAEAGVTLISPSSGEFLIGTRQKRAGTSTQAPKIPAFCPSPDFQLLQDLRLQHRGDGCQLPQHRRNRRAGRMRSAHDFTQASTSFAVLISLEPQAVPPNLGRLSLSCMLTAPPSISRWPPIAWPPTSSVKGSRPTKHRDPRATTRPSSG